MLIFRPDERCIVGRFAKQRRKAAQSKVFGGVAKLPSGLVVYLASFCMG
jgi:hypothetical protein